MKYNEIIWESRTASIIKGKNNRALKLFSKNTLPQIIYKEFNNSQLINDLPFLKVRSHALRKQDGRTGIVYDFIDGKTLDYETNYENYLNHISSLHKDIINCKVPRATEYKKDLQHSISRSKYHSVSEIKKALNVLAKLPNSDTLCHADFHGDNIILSNEKAYCVDFMNICKGPALYDIARCFHRLEHKYNRQTDKNKSPFSFLTEKQREDLAAQYLQEMGVLKSEIEDYLYVIDVYKHTVPRSFPPCK